MNAHRQLTCHASSTLHLRCSSLPDRGPPVVGKLPARHGRHRFAASVVDEPWSSIDDDRIGACGSQYDSGRRPMDRGIPHRVPVVQDSGARPESLHETPARQGVPWKPPTPGGAGNPLQKPVPLPLLQRIHRDGTPRNAPPPIPSTITTGLTRLAVRRNDNLRSDPPSAGQGRVFPHGNRMDSGYV